jgi:hypothetical protein
MPPVRPEQLVGGQQYYIRHNDTFLGPFEGDIGLLPFMYDDNLWFHLSIDPSAIFDAYDEHWLFFPIADGLPVNPAPLVAPRAPRPLPLPYGGRLVVSKGTQNVVSMANIAEGDQLVNWNMNADLEGRRESNFGHYYTMDTYTKLDPKISPISRGLIRNPKRYTASLRVVNTAFPKGSANAGLFERTRSRRMRKRKGKSRKNKRT